MLQDELDRSKSSLLSARTPHQVDQTARKFNSLVHFLFHLSLFLFSCIFLYFPSEMGHFLRLPKCSQYFNVLFTLLIAVSLQYYGIFDCSSRNHQLIVLGILFSTLILSSIIGILKACTVWYDQKYGTERLKKYRRDYTIACGGLLLFSFSSISVIYHSGFNLVIGLYSFFTFNISSLVLYFLFAWKAEQKCRVVRTWKLFVIVALFYMIPAVFKYSLLYYTPYSQHRTLVIVAGFYYEDVWISNTATLIALLIGRIKLVESESDEIHRNTNEIKGDRDSEVGSAENQNSSQSESGEGNGFRISWITIDETRMMGNENNSQWNSTSCAICLVKSRRDPKRPPPVLIECGHTICEECYGNLMKGKKRQYILCPFCQQIIVVQEGSANLLL